MAKSEWTKTTQLIDRAVEILDEQNPMTVRQLFYQLVSRGVIENNTGSYQSVSRVMTKARNDGRCSFDWIVDRSRPEYTPQVWDDAAGYAETVKRSYRKDYWTTQPTYCEIWVEKDAIIGSIEDLTNELGVKVRVGRGFVSTTKAHEIARRFSQVKKDIVIYYLGDHDPSGVSMERELTNRIRAYGSPPFTLKRLAIFAGDIRKFKLPPLRVKMSDSRAEGFLAKYSNRCVELDALPPNELRRRIREAVEELLDVKLWNRAIAVERVEVASILETVSLWPRLASDGV
jgi:hypothetical protein